MPASQWGKSSAGGLDLTGHSQHGSPSDWAKAIGAFPTGLPYALQLAEETTAEAPPRGFLKEEVRALGHWLREKASEEEQAPVRWERTAGGVRPAGAGDAPECAAMDVRYTSGEGRVGTRTEQLRLRARLASYGQAAIAGWCAQWNLPWWRMPKMRMDLRLLTEQPEDVPPATDQCA
jgi:hypothetical protein